MGKGLILNPGSNIAIQEFGLSTITALPPAPTFAGGAGVLAAHTFGEPSELLR